MDWTEAILEALRDSGLASLASIILSAGAFLVAAISLVSNHRSRQRIIAIEEARDDEAKRAKQTAQLRARLQKTRELNSQSSEYALEIENLGQGTAREIRIRVDGIDIKHHPSFSDDGVLPVLGAHSTKRILIRVTRQTPVPSKVELQWTDDTGEKGEYESTL